MRVEPKSLPPLPAIDLSTPPKGERPVKWLAPGQLLRTATEWVKATIFAQLADKREAMASAPRQIYALPPHGRTPDTVWVDFVADTGDGFDATYATARVVAGNSTVDWSDENDKALFEGRCECADLLVLGGDQVYPVASMKEYNARFNSVYLRARQKTPAGGTPASKPDAKVEDPKDPPLVALPGNHDWYDGLVSFRRNFCEAWVKSYPRDTEPPDPNQPGADPPDETPVRPLDQGLTQVPERDLRDRCCGWGAFQSRSYFAVRLNDHWWLWGLG